MSNTTNSSPVHRTLSARWNLSPWQVNGRFCRTIKKGCGAANYRNRTAAGAGENNVRETWKYTERTVKDNDTEAK
jgi:hypothetical protein